MKDFTREICTSLNRDSDDRGVHQINEILNDLDSAGFSPLVQKLCEQTDPGQGWDSFFEIQICCLLRKNPSVHNLEYEPPSEVRPPDFRFTIGSACFDLEVKRLHNVQSEMTKLLLQRECRRLSKRTEPWILNLWVSDGITRTDLNPFFSFVIANFSSFTCDPLPTWDLPFRYQWPPDSSTPIIRFSFFEKPAKTPGINLGMTILRGSPNLMMIAQDTEPTRTAIGRLLKKSRPKFSRPVSQSQVNMVVIHPAGSVMLDKIHVDWALYGEEGEGSTQTSYGSVSQSIRARSGLFHVGNFENITAVVLFPHPLTWSKLESVTATLFPHPLHWTESIGHPKPFANMESHQLKCVPGGFKLL